MIVKKMIHFIFVTMFLRVSNHVVVVVVVVVGKWPCPVKIISKKGSSHGYFLSESCLH